MDEDMTADSVPPDAPDAALQAAHKARSGSWRQVGRLASNHDPQTRLEPVWHDPSTPTLAAQADAAQKNLDAGIIDVAPADPTASARPASTTS